MPLGTYGVSVLLILNTLEWCVSLNFYILCKRLLQCNHGCKCLFSATVYVSCKISAEHPSAQYCQLLIDL